MNLPKERSNKLPQTSIANQVKMRIDYWDVCTKTFTAPCQVPVEMAVKQFFFSIPRWALWLLSFREFISKRLGLKTAAGRESTLRQIERFRGHIGDRIALFEVWHRDAKEIVTGQRDKHLDFVLCFRLDSNESKHTLQLLTAVQINSLLGRIYFSITKPIHRMLMPAIAKRICQRLAESC
jgi:hypothetical protein